MPIGEHEIRTLMRTRGWKQADLARAMDVSQPSVSRWLSGTLPDPLQQERLAQLIAIDPDTSPSSATVRSGYAAAPEILGERDLPVYASVEGGDGAMVVYTDPIDQVHRPWYLKQVKDGYAVLVNGTSMEPVYDPGDIVIVNPRAALVRNKDVIIVSGDDNGEFRASLKRYMGQTPTEWLLKQFNPPEGQSSEFRRLKHEWPRALRVVGKYDGG